MASVIWINPKNYHAYKTQEFTTPYIWCYEMSEFRGLGGKVVISRGNIIDGVEAIN